MLFFVQIMLRHSLWIRVMLCISIYSSCSHGSDTKKSLVNNSNTRWNLAIGVARGVQWVHLHPPQGGEKNFFQA